MNHRSHVQISWYKMIKFLDIYVLHKSEVYDVQLVAAVISTVEVQWRKSHWGM